MNDPTYAVCVPVADLVKPVEGSTVDTCARCETDVWVSPASRLCVQEENATILCARCGLAQMKQELAETGEIEIVTNDLQQREIQQALLNKRL